MTFLINTVSILGLTCLALIFQKNLKIPLPITLLSSGILLSIFGISPLTLDDSQFDTIILLTLPLLIATDSFKLSLKDIQKNGISLFWVAGLGVILSIGIGTLFNIYVFKSVDLNILSIILLFCMISATDPITVSALFSNFKTPHTLKVLTEGESLFNDATALIFFSLALLAFNNPETLTFSVIGLTTLKILGGAVCIGILYGWIITKILKLSDDAHTETTLILFGIYASYSTAEYFHVSGILAVIITTLFSKTVIEKIIASSNLLEYKKFPFSKTTTTKTNKIIIDSCLEYGSILASSVVFLSVISLINFKNLYDHRYEILSLFIVSTLIRALIMTKLAFFSKKTERITTIKKHWLCVLTFSGSKGALSILMVHMLPAHFEHKDLFETLIVGIILLSTFIYTICLSGTFLFFKKDFETDLIKEHS